MIHAPARIACWASAVAVLCWSSIDVHAAAAPGRAAALNAGSPAAPVIRVLPPAARAVTRRSSRADHSARANKLRAAASAAGLKSLKYGGAESGSSSAIYGVGSGRIRGASQQERARNFIASFREVYGLSRPDLDEFEISESSSFLPSHREVRFRRTFRGRPLYGSDLRLHLGPNGEFVAAVGDPYGSMSWRGEPELTEQDAAAHVEAAIRRLAKPDRVGPVRGADLSKARFSEVAYPLGDKAIPAFLATGVVAANGFELFDVVVDGSTGDVLEIVARTNYATAQVFRNPASVPTTPQPSTTPGIVPPSPNPPSYVFRSSATIPILGMTDLAGNNTVIREYQAWTGGLLNSSVGNPITEPSGNFNFPLLLGTGADIRNYPRATGTNLYYILQVAFSYFYGLGFDEAHGNFQLNNFGFGGLEGDPVVAFTQLGSGPPTGSSAYSANNAFMSTPSDGSSPSMGMYVWRSQSTPGGIIYTTDSALDPDIAIHEFAHGVTRRLAPGSLPYIGQSGGMNEGNSDFFALNLLTPPSAPLNGVYPVATYSTQNFQAGLRNYPYSTNTMVNPLTYGDFGKVGSFGPEVHDDGEIWTNTLWEIRAGLIVAFGYATGQTRAGQLVLDALQLLPNDPTYIDFRNAILAADEARYAGADLDVLWAAFAKRGMGTLAAGGWDGYSVSVLADSNLPSPAARVRLWDTDFYGGEQIRLIVADDNAETTGVTFTTSGNDAEHLFLTPNGPSFSGLLPTAFGESVRGDGILQFRNGQTITATVADTDTGGGTPSLVATATGRAPFNITDLGSSLFNAADAPSLLVQGDDTATLVNLAFSFPFFGKNYSAIYVGTNGIASFNTPRGIRQRGLVFPGGPPSIAPFSVDLDCNGANGVYYYNNVDRFTVRWQCVEWSAPANAANVAMTLFPDGAIRFDYGSGNVLTGNDWFTGLPDLATVGLDRGNESFGQAVTGYDFATNLGNANSILLDANTPAPAAPTNVNARAIDTATVYISWDSVAGAERYRIFRRTGSGVYDEVGDTTLTYFYDSVPANMAFLYVVYAERDDRLSPPSAADLAASVRFENDPLAQGSLVRVVHLTQLRNAVNLVRTLAGLPPATFSEMALAGKTIRANDVVELRSGLTAAMSALALPAPVFVDPFLSGVYIRTAHVQQLRDVIK